MEAEVGEDVTTNLGNLVVAPAKLLGVEVVVTARLKGQQAAIDQQVNSNTIVNVVSSERIREVPDNNAAETTLGTDLPDAGKYDDFRASSYQRYNLWKRFDLVSYYGLSRGMDTHHMVRGRGGVASVLGKISSPTLVISIDTDILFPIEEQGMLSRYIPNGRPEVMHSDYRHDGFLTEAVKIGEFLADFLKDQLRVDATTKRAFTDGLTGRKFAVPGSEEI